MEQFASGSGYKTLRGAIWTLTGAGCVAVFATLLTTTPIAAVGEPAQGRAASLVALGKQFDGAASCASQTTGCHNSPAAAPAPGPLLTENTTWNDLDRHSKAYLSLRPKKADIAKRPSLAKTAIIAKALGIKKPEKDAKCLSCHSLNAPENLQSEKNGFSLAEGVSCNSCHGPSQDWRGEHNKKDWTEKQRLAVASAKGDELWKGQASHQELLTKFGLYDTKPLVARAEICVSCHLAIDPKLVEAGHPQPYFELNKFQEDEPKHWRERPEHAGFGHVRIWAVGQVVCLRDAMRQLAERAGTADTKPETLKDSLAQALGHFAMVKQLSDAKVMAVDSATLDAGKALLDMLASGKLDASAIVAPATGIASHFKGLADAALAVPTDQATLDKLLASVAADDVAKTLGLHGGQQQALALWSLHSASPTAKPDDAANKSIQSLLESTGGETAFDAAVFGTKLKAAQETLKK